MYTGSETIGAVLGAFILDTDRLASSELDSVLSAYSRTFRVRLKDESGTVLNATVLKMSSQRGGTSGGLTFGGVFSHAISMDLIYGTDLTGQYIYVEIGVLNNNAFEYIPFAKVKVASWKFNGEYVTAKAYDALGFPYQKVNISASDGYPRTVSEIFESCADLMGIEFDSAGVDQDIEMTATIANGSYTLDIKDALHYAALHVGANVFIGRTGKLEVHSFNESMTPIINNNIIAESNMDGEYRVDKITCSYPGGSLDMRYAYPNDIYFSGIRSEVGFYTPFVGNDDDAHRVLLRAYIPSNSVGSIDIMLGNPMWDPWDKVRYYDSRNKKAYTLLASSMALEYDGGISMNVESEAVEDGDMYDSTETPDTDAGSEKLDVEEFREFVENLGNSIYGELKDLPVTDLNNLKDPDAYLGKNVSSLSNYPSPNGSRIEVIKLGGSYIKQIVHPNATTCVHYERVWNGSAWGTWMKFTGTAV